MVRRLEHWQDALRGVPDFLTTGSGLGTYRFIYRRYQDSFQEGWYYHAENQYLEALLEGGLIGLGLLCGCLLVAACGLWLLLRRAESPVALALGVTGGFALVSQALQSCFDFGLYLPSNSILFASLLGLSLRAADEVGAAPSPSQPRRLSLTVTLVLLSLLCWGTYELTRRARVEARIAAAKKIEPLPDADPQRVERALRGLRALDDPAAGARRWAIADDPLSPGGAGGTDAGGALGGGGLDADLADGGVSAIPSGPGRPGSSCRLANPSDPESLLAAGRRCV